MSFRTKQLVAMAISGLLAFAIFQMTQGGFELPDPFPRLRPSPGATQNIIALRFKIEYADGTSETVVPLGIVPLTLYVESKEIDAITPQIVANIDYNGTPIEIRMSANIQFVYCFEIMNISERKDPVTGKKGWIQSFTSSQVPPNVDVVVYEKRITVQQLEDWWVKTGYEDRKRSDLWIKAWEFGIHVEWEGTFPTLEFWSENPLNGYVWTSRDSTLLAISVKSVTVDMEPLKFAWSVQHAPRN